MADRTGRMKNDFDKKCSTMGPTRIGLSAFGVDNIYLRLYSILLLVF